jgi:iron complex outermembrane receptor protein
MRPILAIAVLHIITIVAGSAVAQESTGSIEGRLLDGGGDIVDFANVVVTGPAVADSRGVMSTSEGFFVLANLPPGTYSVRIFHISFNQLVLKDILVEAGQTSELGDLVLTEGVFEISPIVITGSRKEQPLENTPVAMTVLSEGILRQMPVDDYQDVFRMVPGMNVTMNSAGDISINARRATGLLAVGTLAMVDNRTIYNDFNGQVWWMTIPVEPVEIKRVEVQRGPGGAIWGANSTDGVVNIITKAPREMQGTSLRLGAGELETAYGSLIHAGMRDKLGYKLTAGYYQQIEPYERPTGTIPGTDGPANPGGTPYPDYPNEGTEQLKFNGRVDYDQDEKTRWSASAGYAAFEGLLLLPGGPGKYDPGSYSAFAKAQWSRQAMEANLYFNYMFWKGNGVLNPLFTYADVSRLVSFDFSDSRLLGDWNLITYGGAARHGNFDIGVMPDASDRNEFGVFVQDEMRFNEYFTGIVGVRVDNIDPFGTKASPRASVLFSPYSGHTFRVSANRAYRAPTWIENYLDFTTPTVITIPTPGGPLDLFFPLLGKAPETLEPEELTSFEIGWVGNWNDRVESTASAYYNDTENIIRWMPISFYSSANPPPGWPLDPDLLDVPPPNGFAGIPAQMGYVNLGNLKTWGTELSLAVHYPKNWSVFLNYSWQDFETENITQLPMPDGRLVFPFNAAPEHRFNGAVVWDMSTVFANAAVTYQDVAFFTDFLDQRFWGHTDSFVATNLGAGVRLDGGRMVFSVNANNIFDERVQQHIFGDIIGRKIWAQVSYRL